MADKEMVAATLAASLIQAAGKAGLDAAKKKPAEFAVHVYFQCLDELTAAEKKRLTPAKVEELRP